MTDPFVPATSPVEDDASLVVNTFISAMLAAFNPADPVQPPLAGGSTVVRFFAADAVPLELWDAHATGSNCAEPFLWVRMTKRYRSRDFPTPSSESFACSLPRVIGLEIGVGRCSSLSVTPDWDQVQLEAEYSLDDSWRLELALCRAVSDMQAQNRLVSIDSIVPFGPEGGVIAWSATAAVKL